MFSSVTEAKNKTVTQYFKSSYLLKFLNNTYDNFNLLYEKKASIVKAMFTQLFLNQEKPHLENLKR